jgi:hypothetical protein
MKDTLLYILYVVDTNMPVKLIGIDVTPECEADNCSTPEIVTHGLSILAAIIARTYRDHNADAPADSEK